jgi:hypothetical protein
MTITTDTESIADTPAVIPTEEKTFGADNREAHKAYQLAVEQANTVREAAMKQSNAAMQAARKAIRELLADGGTTQGHARAVIDLVETLSYPHRTETQRAVESTYSLVTRRAQEVYDEARTADAFSEFVSTYIANTYGESYANAINAAMPLTFEGLRNLASTERWCTDYESAMRIAVSREALPADTRRIVMRVPNPARNVPSDLNPQYDEEWMATLDIPAYVRSEDAEGDTRPFSTMAQFAVGEVSFARQDTAASPERVDGDDGF